jgi:hypothetical protein
MDERYDKLRMPPKEALRTIDVGKLKGKSDINPQWKIEALTDVFGLCGVGWRFMIENEETYDCESGEVLLYMKVALQVKDGDKWSEPVYGYGGDFIIQKNKNGLVPNDEAYKMCLTDALGNAMKCVGVAADVFRGIYDTKYQKMQEQAKAQADEGANLQKKIFALAKAKNCVDKMPAIIKEKYNKQSTKELSVEQLKQLVTYLETEVKE